MYCHDLEYKSCFCLYDMNIFISFNRIKILLISNTNSLNNRIIINIEELNK